MSLDFARKVAIGAGLSEEEFKTTQLNAEELLKKAG
jgi:hypothetical protein